MTIKCFGEKCGGWIELTGFRFRYYFYWVKQRLDNEKVWAKVWQNGNDGYYALG